MHQNFRPNAPLAIYDLQRAASKHWCDILCASVTNLRQKKYQQQEID
jgi:hypothetical protein